MLSHRYFSIVTLVITLILMLWAGHYAQAATIYVPVDFGTIQSAIADPGTVNGDEIVVLPGTYVETINFLGKAITLQSFDPSDPAVVAATIIDGGAAGSVVTCNTSETSTTVLDGFTITNGSASSGGGMYNDGASPTVTNCTFSGNTANFDGGGMFNDGDSPTVTNCTFIGNTAFFGGGMYNSTISNPAVTNCTFSQNSATSNGGGMYNLTRRSRNQTGSKY